MTDFDCIYTGSRTEMAPVRYTEGHISRYGEYKTQGHSLDDEGIEWGIDTDDDGVEHILVVSNDDVWEVETEEGSEAICQDIIAAWEWDNNYSINLD